MQSVCNIITTHSANVCTWRWVKGNPCKCEKSWDNTVCSCGHKLTAWVRSVYWVWWVWDCAGNFRTVSDHYAL